MYKPSQQSHSTTHTQLTIALYPFALPQNFAKMLARTAVKPTVARTASRKAVTVRAQAQTQVHY
jgi:hypothetical protein